MYIVLAHTKDPLLRLPDKSFVVERNNNQKKYVYFWVAFLQRENDGIWAWELFKQLFNYLPHEALIIKKIICMHGRITRSLYPVNRD